MAAFCILYYSVINAKGPPPLGVVKLTIALEIPCPQ